jgi:hypothetical protein
MHAVFSVKYPLVRGECEHSGKDKPRPDALAKANADVTEASTDGGEEASLEDKDDQGNHESMTVKREKVIEAYIQISLVGEW